MFCDIVIQLTVSVMVTSALSLPILSMVDKQNQLRIIGGSTAQPGQFIYQVSLRSSPEQTHFCGGSIISESWILTAGHCVWGRHPTDMIAVVGAHHSNHTLDRSAFVNHAVEEIFIQEKFSMGESMDPIILAYDIAVLRLEKVIEFNDNVGFIEYGTEYVGAGELGTASGWGVTDLNKPYTIADELHYLNQTTLTNQDCRARLQSMAHVVHGNHLCAISFIPGTGLCGADSGSPLVVEGKVVGIACFVAGRCAQGFPDMYVRTTAHRDWIAENMALK